MEKKRRKRTYSNQEDGEQRKLYRAESFLQKLNTKAIVLILIIFLKLTVIKKLLNKN